MASRILHLAVCRLLTERLDIKDPERFKLGHILPDCVPGEKKRQVNSHFIRSENGLKVFDALGFFGRYEREVMEDGLYLGYYLHLIEDNVFRRVLYYDLGLLARRGERGLFDGLYLDYNRLNIPAAERYGVDGRFEVPEDLHRLRISEIYPFDTEWAIGEIREQLRTPAEGEPALLTKDAAFGFIENSAEVCEKEYQALRRGEHHVGRWELAIEDVYSAKAERRN